MATPLPQARQSIAVVEPQMEDLFHAPFNAALLHAVVLAYPETAVSFRAYPEHSRIVRSILEQHAPDLIEHIEWRSLSRPRSQSLFARWRQSYRSLREILAPQERVLFCSISRMQLMQLKHQLRKSDQGGIRAVLHGDLDQIESPPYEGFPMRLFALQRVLNLPHPPGLRYLVLGQSIRDNIPAAFEQALADPGVIDHPYHFPPVRPIAPSPLVFGIFGNIGEGTLVEEVVRRVKAVDPAVRFRLVGFVSGQEPKERLQPLVEDVDDKPIPRETFVERAQRISYALWLAPPASSRLRASGTFFDALAYGKPLIYTASSFIDPYFALEPGIGIRCETAEDVPEAILLTAAGHSEQNYAEAVAAIERLRSRFTPQELAKTLPSSLEWDPF